ncbi:hypothetical protein ACEWY4_001329 [Coilia grayii]|uniref:Voltage-dependent calcium channel alpha-2/delta subunit conserved region domain-containing protein n=1 Tax=Coilia grayii TaxID=363190 RepID=A0ABD1KSM6_9TELE
MIDGETGNRTFTTFVKSHDERYIDRAVRTYTWGHIRGTNYSLALVLPKYSLHYLHAAIGDTITQAKFSETLQVEKFDEYGFTFIAKREYCTDLKPSDNNTDFLINFNKYIDRNTPNHPLCNSALVNKLLLDAGITSELVKKWSKQIMSNGVSARFVATDGGITRVYPSSAGPDWSESIYNTNDIYDVYEMRKSYNTHESNFYQRSLDNELYIFTPPVYNFNYNATVDSILVSKAVDLDIDGVKLKPAVVGVTLDVEFWLERFMNTTVKINPSGSKDDICSCQRNDEFVDCVLLDDGGFLIMANRDDYVRQIGQFFGMIDPSMMMSLINSSLFSVRKTYDYLSMCEVHKESKSAAGLRSVYVPTIADILQLGWWTSSAAWSIMQQLLVTVTFPSFSEAVDTNDDLSDDVAMESCINEQSQYFFENNETSFYGILDCDRCSRQFHAEKLQGTNLVFVVADTKLACMSCDQKPLIQGKQPSPGPDPCELALNPRYRKGPQSCFDNNASEQDGDCGGVSGLMPSPWMLVLLQVSLLLNACGHRLHDNSVMLTG